MQKSQERIIFETVDTLTTVVSKQSEIIDELFGLLMQHISAEEADKLPVIDKICEVVGLREKLEEVK